MAQRGARRAWFVLAFRSETQLKMFDQDLIELTMHEAQRLSAESVGANPFKENPAIEKSREVLEDLKHGPRHLTDRRAQQIADLDLETGIHLRWTLRDIKGRRTKFSPVSPGDLRNLIEMGLIEMQDHVPVLTANGNRAID
jgi:hypothetical protein